MTININTIYQGDALAVLKTFSDECIDCIVTSPPYYGLRNYNVDGQLGHEKTPKEYVDNLMAIMDQCHRVLKKKGSLWVNIGDTYAASRSYKVNGTKATKDSQPCNQNIRYSGIADKSLIGIPERFVVAMTDSSLKWIRRNTIIWHKPNAMPSSAKDRFTVDFEYFYFFTKSKKYYFETQYEPNKTVGCWSTNNKQGSPYIKNNPRLRPKKDYDGRVKRAVWSIPTQSFLEAHFATFPDTLIATPIKACCPDNGVVLDPFFGSGTVGVVAKRQGKNYVGIELNSEYIDMAKTRIESTPPTLLRY